MTCKPYKKIKSIIQNDNLIYRKKIQKFKSISLSEIFSRVICNTMQYKN